MLFKKLQFHILNSVYCVDILVSFAYFDDILLFFKNQNLKVLYSVKINKSMEVKPKNNQYKIEQIS